MFRFRLQRILDMRQKREQAIAVQLADARTAEELARAAAESLERARAEGALSASLAQSQKLTAGQLQNLRFVVDRMDDHLEFAEQEVEAAREVVDQRLGEFTTAFRDRKVLDRLRERDLDGWRADEVRADRTLMDEVALSRFVRRDAGKEGPK